MRKTTLAIMVLFDQVRQNIVRKDAPVIMLVIR